MRKQLIIHDLDNTQLVEALGGIPEGTQVFAASPAVRHCVGCFGCWTKTPAQCVIRDRCGVTPEMLAVSDEMVIISRNLYGGYSPDVKAVLDRSIAYILPFFRIVGGEMHHTMRYDNPFAFHVHFYGDAVTDAEQDLSRKLVAANAVNLGAGSHSVDFHKTLQSMKGMCA